jgi:hypothetical protein
MQAIGYADNSAANNAALRIKTDVHLALLWFRSRFTIASSRCAVVETDECGHDYDQDQGNR